MRVLGAFMQVEVGGFKQYVKFDTVHWCVSLKEHTVNFNYADMQECIEPHKKFLACTRIIDWFKSDNASPFRDGSLYVDWDDKGITKEDIEKYIADNQSKFQEKKEVMPEGYPTDKWRPKYLMQMFDILKPDNADRSNFMLWGIAKKAKFLAEYMKHKDLKPEAYVSQLHAD